MKLARRPRRPPPGLARRAPPPHAALARGRAGRTRRGGWVGGWWRAAAALASPNHGPRPRGVPVDLVVLHSISLPPGEYGGPAIAQLFTNTLDPASHPSFAGLEGLQVSAHFLIRRDGRALQFVDVDRRAWHAGLSSWRGRPGCNDVSVGIELEGLEGLAFEPAQMRTLRRLLRALARRWPGLREVVGHEHVAPGRKGDPGPGFDWHALVADRGWPRRLAAWPDADGMVRGFPGA